MNAYTSGLIIKKNTEITKERRLPIKGKVLCSKGDSVDYDTIIAQGEIKGHLATFHFTRELGVNPENIEKYLLPKIGDSIHQGDVLGKTGSFFGIFKTSVKSPYTGVLEYINKETGSIGIRLDSVKINLNAYIKGTVTHIIENEGAVISTKGTYIQGIFGIGGEKFGKLKMTVLSPEQNLEIIPHDIKDCILVSGKDITYDTLKKCEEAGVCGIIAGSVSDTVIKEYTGKELGVAITGDENTKLTIIITEGFGSIPMSQSTFDILKEINGKNISISGATQIRAGVIRPEIIMSENTSSAETALTDTTLSVGSKIRIMSEPYLCRYGFVTKIFTEPILLETGCTASCVEVDLNGEKAIIPRTNIEIIYS